MAIKNKLDNYEDAFYDADNIAKDVIRTYLDNICVKENEVVSDFLNENEDLKERLISEQVHTELYNYVQSRDKENDIIELTTILDTVQPSLKPHPNIHIRNIVVAAASVAILLLILTFGLNYFANNEGAISKSDSTPIVLPHDKKATITLSNGQTIAFGEEQLVLDENGEPVVSSLHSVEVMKNEDIAALDYTTITVPRGGKLFVTLPDESGVWINSESEVRFPTSFSRKERRIKLRGEVFFDVVHDKSRPFIVELDKGEILVYGTRFNINNYENSNLKAVLVNGSIGFTNQYGDTRKLSPSQKMECDPNNEINIETVDTSIYTSWIDDVFIFNRERLVDIMSSLSRRYDVNVVFENKQARDIVLSGKINNGEDLNTLLRVYESIANIKFLINGNTIIVLEK